MQSLNVNAEKQRPWCPNAFFPIQWYVAGRDIRCTRTLVLLFVLWTSPLLNNMHEPANHCWATRMCGQSLSDLSAQLMWLHSGLGAGGAGGASVHPKVLICRKFGKTHFRHF